MTRSRSRSCSSMKLFAVAMCLLGSACSASNPPSFPDGADLGQKVEITRRHVGCPGMVVGVYRDHKPILRQAFGVADQQTGEPLTLDHHFRVASFAKPAVATALLVLADEGKVSLDDTIGQYIAGVPQGDRITLRMLAQHTSGLPNYIALPQVKEAFAAEPQRRWTEHELLAEAFAFQGGSLEEPGEAFVYSNTGYVLLGQLLEELEGKPLAQVLQDRVFAPLGLKNTFYSVDLSIPAPVARGHQYGDADGPIYWRGEGGVIYDVTDTSPSMWHGAGALVSTHADVVAMLRAFTEGTLLSDSSHAEQTTWFDADYPFGIEYSYGLGLVNYHGAIGHNGQVPGYQMTASHVPDEGLTVVVLANLYSSSNYEEPANAVYYVVMKHLTGDSWAPPNWPGW